jgi:uncharacterized integral membrane protein
MFFAAMLAAIISVVFAMQNNVPVTVTFLFWRFDSSLAMVLLLALALGATTVALLAAPSSLRRKWQLGRQKKHIAELEATCDDQRNRITSLEAQVPGEQQAAKPEA